MFRHITKKLLICLVVCNFFVTFASSLRQRVLLYNETERIRAETERCWMHPVSTWKKARQMDEPYDREIRVRATTCKRGRHWHSAEDP